ncbi:ferritin-like domain-containing protein [Neochlamydia sp. S13]|uniref:YciE/YciF ferroxidase family protein n=1 Tax=Neochlamydia sp. S13 TaxID=1353976 RepID=UPI0005A6A735|nr:DUF892 family protein [Neochlamydia sp. S13]BBI17895.1 Uncharacterized protein NCS13_1_1700 [Neochlamydia sp. S13]
MEKNSALDLFLETGLRHLYNAERETHDNLKTLASQSSNQALKDAFSSHILETENQIRRLQQSFGMLNIDPTSSKIQGISNFADKGRELMKTLLDLNFTDRSKGMDGILNEGKELIRHFADTDSNDIALISAAHKVEHYEIACYNLICFLCEHYKQKEIVNLMKLSLEEEKRMGEKLLEIARRDIKLPAFPPS